MHLSQIISGNSVAVVARDGAQAYAVNGATSNYQLAQQAADTGLTLAAVIAAQGYGATVDLVAQAAPGQLTLPIMHPDPGHLHLTGTGLTHPGPAAARDAMHVKTDADDATDLMKMIRTGLENGKPAHLPAVLPEWFYKGNGHSAAAPGAPITSPGFALDAGEEPEIAGIYIIAADGSPARVDWAQANELFDNVTERINDLYLAHSKLRPASFGPEIRIGDLPGDQHVNVFGTATLSFADGIKPTVGDSFAIEAAAFGLPLINPLAIAADRGVATVKPL